MNYFFIFAFSELIAKLLKHKKDEESEEESVGEEGEEEDT